LAKTAIEADLEPFWRDFGMRELWRLTLWAMAATFALVLAAFAVSTEPGRHRMRFAVGQIHDMIRSSGAKFVAPLNAREERQLADTVGRLLAERDRLLARIATLEHSVGDISGSLARVEQAAQAAQAAWATQTAHAVQDARAPDATPAAEQAPAAQDASATQETLAVQGVPQPEAAAATADDVTSSVNPPDGVPMPPPAPAMLQAERSSSNTETKLDAETKSDTGTKTQFGLDLGGASTVAELRRLWKTTQRQHAARLARLRPIVQPHRSTIFGGTEWRLVAGPIANAATAARLCAALVEAGGNCRPAIFQGQRLTVR